MDFLRLASALLGIIIILVTFYWGAQVLMVRTANAPFAARMILRGSRNFLHFAGSIVSDASTRQNIWALYVPFSLVTILGASLVLITIGYALLFYGISSTTWDVAMTNSISSISVLGIGGNPGMMRETVVAGIEAFTGPIFVALLIGYIINIYAAYSKLHDRVAVMDAHQGKARDGAELLEAAAAKSGIDSLNPLWKSWADDLEQMNLEYRTVDGYLLLFSPAMTRHWSTNAVIVFDAANLRNTLVDLPPDPEGSRLIETGSAELEAVANHYGHRTISFRRAPRPIEITHEEFTATAGRLQGLGIAVASDPQRAWEQFEHRRGSYAPATYQLQRMQVDLRER